MASWPRPSILLCLSVIALFGVACHCALNETNCTPDLRLVAFFFPQYHQIEENDRFWGWGFTEWTNVQQAFWNSYGQRIAHPSEFGYYNQLDYVTRARQAQLAKQYGIYGFCYHHYWFKGRPVMEQFLFAMLEDGQPDLPFCLNWANEPWSRRWDGGDESVMLEQDYGDEDGWREHFEWLLPFLLHRNYICVAGEPLLLIYRIGLMPRGADMVAYWKRLAISAGLPGLHVVQCLGRYEDSRSPFPFVDAVAEFEPNYHAQFNSLFHQTARAYPVHYRGTFVGWDNTPRHVSHPDDAGVLLASHPDTLFRRLRLNLGAARRDPNRCDEDYFFLNAWNEWGEGNSLEPNNIYGRGYIEAVRKAIEAPVAADAPSEAGITTEVLSSMLAKAAGCGLAFDAEFYLDLHPDLRAYFSTDYRAAFKHFTDFGFEEGRFFRFSPVAPAAAENSASCIQLTKTLTRQLIALTDLRSIHANHGSVCIIVRTYAEHANRTLDRLISSLLAQTHVHWEAIFVPTDDRPFPELKDILERFGDRRLHWYNPASAAAYSRAYAAYPATDEAALQCRNFSDIEWIMFTNGDNTYLPGTLAAVDPAYDLILLGFRSRWLSWNEAMYEWIPASDRCERLADDPCVWLHNLTHPMGGIDLGAMVIGYGKWIRERRNFTSLTQLCPECQDSEMVKQLVASGWRLKKSTTCALTHNPTPWSCAAEGKTWFDSPFWSEYRCYDRVELEREAGKSGRLDLKYAERNRWRCIRYAARFYGAAVAESRNLQAQVTESKTRFVARLEREADRLHS